MDIFIESQKKPIMVFVISVKLSIIMYIVAVNCGTTVDNTKIINCAG